MADAQLSTSITSISERASEVAVSASADELQKISRVAPSLEQSENAALEVAINTRAAAIAGTASASDLKKIGKAIGNMLEPQTASVSGEFIGAQTNHSGKFFSTNGTAKNWGGVTMGGLQQVQLSTIENDQTLVYNSVSGKFENSSRAFDIPQYSLTQNLPASANAGEVVFDVQSSQLKYWNGTEWKVAAVVAASGGASGGVTWTRGSSFNITHPDQSLTPIYGGWSYGGPTGGGWQLDVYGTYIAFGDPMNQSDNSSNANARRGRVYIYDMSSSTTTPIRTYKYEDIPHGPYDSYEFGKCLRFWTNPTNDKLYLLIRLHASGNWYAYNVTDGSLSAEFQFGGYSAGFGAQQNATGVISADGKYWITQGGWPAGIYVYDLVNVQTTHKWFTEGDSSYQELRNQGHCYIDSTTGYLIVTDPKANSNRGAINLYDISDLDTQAPSHLATYTFDSSVPANWMVGYQSAFDDSTKYLYMGNDTGEEPNPIYVFDVSTLTDTDGQNHSIAPTDAVLTIPDPRVDENGNSYSKNSHTGWARTGMQILGDKLYVGDYSGTSSGAEGNGLVQVFNLSDGSHVEAIPNPHPEIKARWPAGGFKLTEDPNSDTVYLVGVAKTNSGSGGFGFWNAENHAEAIGYSFTRDSASSGSGESSESSAVSGKIIVGSWRDNDNGAASGSVYVYDLDGTNEVKITASDGAAEDSFGWTVAVDGGKVAIGARNDDDNGASSGSVYVYDLDGSNEVKITSNDSSNYDYFGNVVALGEGKLAVGARNSGSTNGKGAVYVYEVSDLTSAPTKLVAADVADGDDFGASISITSNKLVIGSPEDDDVGGNSGSVYVYDASNLSATPTKLTAFDGSSDKKFGLILAANDDYIVVSSGVEFSTGAIYVYDASNLSAQPTKLSEGVASDKFGISIAVSSTHIVVGARGDSTVANAAGAVYVYDASNLSASPTKLTASDGAFDDQFGISVAIGNNKILVGANQDDDGGNLSGSIYVYDLDGTNEVKITASDGASGDQFGRAVAIGQSAGSAGSASSGSGSSTPVDWSPLTISTTVASSVYNLTDTAPELLTNPSFESEDISNFSDPITGWNDVSYGWYVDNSSAIMANTTSWKPLVQGPLGLSVGQTYTAKIVVSAVSGLIKFDLCKSNGGELRGNTTDGFGVTISSPGTYTFNFTYTGYLPSGPAVEHIGIGRQDVTGSSVTVDSVSLKLANSGGTTGESDLSVDMSETHTVVGIDKAYSGYGAIKLIDNSTGVVQWSVNNPNPVTAGSFGRRNSVGTDGTHVVVGNRDQDEVYVYNISGTLLRTISGPDSGAMFGHSVKIDGDYIAVGGYNQDKAYICSTSTGAVLHTLTNPNVYGSTPDQFGQVVDISGNFMVVSTVEEDAADGSNSGVAYVYTVDAGSLLHTFVNPNAHGTSALDNFGIDCALDGNYLVVGAFGESDAAVGSGSGKAYFYNVATGTLLHTIDNPNPDSGTEVDYMGWSVDVDGQTALVSAWYETGTAGADAGKCYLYDVVSGNLLHTIEDPDLYSASGTDDRFGSEVAIAGNYFAVSAKGEDHSGQDNVGALYVFKGE